MPVCGITCKPCAWCTRAQPAEAELLEEPVPDPHLHLELPELNQRVPLGPRRPTIAHHVPDPVVPDPARPFGVPDLPPIQIISAVKEHDVEYVVHTPENERALMGHPFECPICFRFGDHILKTRCCRQHVCHSCAQKMRLGFERSSCPHCRQRPLILVDPEPSDPVRSYRDSPRFSLQLLAPPPPPSP